MSTVSRLVPQPGSFIKEELEARGWTQRDLAFVLGCPEQAVTLIISGKRGISPDMAKALAGAFDVPADFFMNLQKAYDLAKAREPDPDVARRARLQEQYPVREMIKRGWLEDTDASLLELQLARYFNVATANEIPHLRHAAKKTHYDDTPPAQLAWLFRVKQIAQTIVVPPYSERRLTDALGELRRFLAAPEELRHVPRVLNDCGVRFVLVEALPQGKIDGVTTWLDSRSPVIGLAMRHDRIDNFWFVLRHEIEHVLRKHGQKTECLDSELEGKKAAVSDDLPPEERQANSAAAEFCVPQAQLIDFIARVRPFFSEERVVLFARKIGVHPGLVVGQLQFKLDKYDFLKRHQVKIRQILIQTSLTDGWGQVLPTTL